jgi:hypothetical protein
LSPISSGVVLGQFVILSALAAFVPQRLIGGLLAAALYVVVSDYALTAFGGTGAIRGFVLLGNGFVVLSSLAVLQAVRLVAGWRIRLAATSDAARPGQFRVADLLEWVTTIAVCLASVVWLNHLFRESGRPNALTLLNSLAPPLQLTLLGAPIALVMLSAKPLAAWRVAGLVLWTTVIMVGLFLFDLRHPRMTVQILLSMAPQSLIPHLVAFLGTVAGNAIVLRSMGFRCHASSKLGQGVLH